MPIDAKQTYEPVGEFVRIFCRGGRWYANFQHSGKQVRRSLKTTNKKEARRRALLLEKDILAGEYNQRQRAPKLQEVVADYLTYLRSLRRSSKTI
jgi:hypothetical protein